MPAINRLSNTLEAIVEDLALLSRDIPIRSSNNHGGQFVIVAPNYHWGDQSDEQKHKHLKIVRRYKQIFELLSAWLYDAPKSLKQELEHGDKSFKTWLELGSNWSLSADKSSNEQLLRASADSLRKITNVLAATRNDRLVLIPDTNSLLGEPDPAKYRSLFDIPTYDFLLLPTVLKELDTLKVLHRNPDVREKAQKMIARIKGWRNQGPLLDGVTVDKTILVRAIHNEPDVASSLSWLDAENADDRIIASVLRVQADSPSARIVLVTGDINLLNKADAALIEAAELS